MSLRRLAALYKNPCARLNLSVLVQYKRINKICPFWARTITVIVFRDYLGRDKPAAQKRNTTELFLMVKNVLAAQRI